MSFTNIRTYLILILLFSGSIKVNAQTATAPSGSGTESDPYLIASLENLYWITQNSSSWASHFKQTADIDASSSLTWDSGAGFSPIGNSTTYFTGTYDGDGFTISGLYIYRTSGISIRVGLFGETNSASITNIGLLDVDITSTGNTGALIGIMQSTDVSNSYAKGKISGGYYAGGLVGWAWGSSTITSSYTATFVKGTDFIGGLIGSIDSGAQVDGCYATKSEYLETQNGITFQLYDAYHIGGLAGNNEGTIRNSYAEVTIFTEENAGGVVGQNDGGSIYTSYANSTVWNDSTRMRFGEYGFFIGSIRYSPFPKGTFLNNYYNSEVGGAPTLAIGDNTSRSGITGLTAQEMKQDTSFSGFDFSSTWNIFEDISTPFLLNNIPSSYPSGSGTIADPYLISSLDALIFLSQQSSFWDKHYKQTVDIDATSTQTMDDGDGGDAEGFSPIGTLSSKFSGTYNGNGKTISNLYISRENSENIGLFGYLGAESVVHSLGIKEAQVTGGNRVGALVGTAQGASLYNVYSTSSVAGSDWVGGLIGWLTSNSILSRSYSTSNVQASTTAGGLVGYIVSSTVENSFATGNVSAANAQTGGLIGFNFGGTITNSYATGLAQNNGTQLGAFVGGNNATGTITNSYWNSKMSGMTEAVGLNVNNQAVTDLSFSQMSDQTNFTGWDFASDSVWAIDEGYSFPYLPNTGDLHMIVAKIDGNEGWRMLGQSGSATYDQFLRPLWTQGFEGSDAGTSGSSNVYYYNESTQSWAAPTSADNYFGTADTVTNTSMSGALVYVYADDDNDGTDDSWPKYIAAENSNINESFDISLSYTDNVSADSAGWHLMSNPYPVSLDWTEIVTNNHITNTIPVAYVWDDTLNSGSGAFRINYGYPMPPGMNQDFIFDGKIPAMQAFWVKATADNASISFRPSQQSSSVTQYKSSGSNLSDASWLKLNIQNGAYSDQITLFGTSENGYSYDVPKLRTISFNYVEMEMLSDESKWLSRTLADSVQEFPLNVLSTESGEFIFSWDFDEYFFDLYDVSLVDTLSGIEIMLSEETSHSFILGENGFPGFKLIVIPKLGVSTEADSDLPKTFELSQNYPNPFNPSTTIDYQLPQRSEVKLMVFDVLGRLVSTLVDDNQAAGVYNIRFDASYLASGIYLYTLQTGNTVITKKMMLIK